MSLWQWGVRGYGPRVPPLLLLSQLLLPLLWVQTQQLLPLAQEVQVQVQLSWQRRWGRQRQQAAAGRGCC